MSTQPLSLDDLLELPDRELGRLDIAWQNLECAVGLPGAEDLDIGQCMRRLDELAALVRDETEKRVRIFQQNPAGYDNSNAIFRMVVLVNHLQLECGVRYNPDRIYDPDFTDSRHLFIHGLFTEHGGTCASMPVFYVSVGRRLGYPLWLVHAKGHVFVRWDDADGVSSHPPERVNIEGATRGMDSFPDEYYRGWPTRIDDEEIESRRYLESLTPREALASFLAMRGHCLQDNSQFEAAAHAYYYAHLFAPHLRQYGMWHNVNLALCGVPVPEGHEGVEAIATAERERLAGLPRV